MELDKLKTIHKQLNADPDLDALLAKYGLKLYQIRGQTDPVAGDIKFTFKCREVVKAGEEAPVPAHVARWHSMAKYYGLPDDALGRIVLTASGKRVRIAGLSDKRSDAIVLATVLDGKTTYRYRPADILKWLTQPI